MYHGRLMRTNPAEQINVCVRVCVCVRACVRACVYSLFHPLPRHTLISSSHSPFLSVSHHLAAASRQRCAPRVGAGGAGQSRRPPPAAAQCCSTDTQTHARTHTHTHTQTHKHTDTQTHRYTHTHTHTHTRARAHTRTRTHTQADRDKANTQSQVQGQVFNEWWALSVVHARTEQSKSARLLAYRLVVDLSIPMSRWAYGPAHAHPPRA